MKKKIKCIPVQEKNRIISIVSKPISIVVVVVRMLQPILRKRSKVNTEPWTRCLNPGPDACYNLNLKINIKLTLNPIPDAVVSSVSPRVVH